MTLCRLTQGAGTIALFIFWSVSEIASIVEAQTHVRRPIAATWSDKSYGPDGPWQAVQVNIGSSSQQIDLYPGGTWETIILLQDICTNITLTSDCYVSDAGVFSSTASTTWDNTSIDYSPDGSSYAAYSFGQTRAVPINALARRAVDTIRFNGFTTPSVDIVGIDQGYQTYAGGQNYPLTVGILSLSAPDLNQSFPETSGPSINTTFIVMQLGYDHLFMDT
ncbi:uncharacterized protein TRUGW13939_10295 [Talaromyces rugulosus]|uniref:Peptidase A1 domain-containing protein n=1 Tax=Talaromyces rugulosus TaxID=121627 RepID=A0A7H8RAJ8_TALRU|nr:uncharacterized protein TRUGW13939_10295 [Talaromyces rugulosus]QKX63127.1 hypothetical protein TRUGW13939_10295 [Talaromyces rugulosus]